jgi:hypothetical protein
VELSFQCAQFLDRSTAPGPCDADVGAAAQRHDGICGGQFDVSDLNQPGSIAIIAIIIFILSSMAMERPSGSGDGHLPRSCIFKARKLCDILVIQYDLYSVDKADQTLPDVVNRQFPNPEGRFVDSLFFGLVAVDFFAVLPMELVCFVARLWKYRLRLGAVAAHCLL